MAAAVGAERSVLVLVVDVIVQISLHDLLGRQFIRLHRLGRLRVGHLPCDFFTNWRYGVDRGRAY